MADPGAELGGQGDAFNPLLLLPIAFLTILWFSPNSQTFLSHSPSYLPPPSYHSFSPRLYKLIRIVKLHGSVAE